MYQIRYIILFVVLIPILGNISCKKSPPEYRFQETEAGIWELVWNDEFDYEGMPDDSKWNFDTAGNKYGWGNNEQQWYTENKENVFVENGILTITALKEEAGDKPYTSARLTTKGKGDWKYGRIEVRAKLPGGKGTWSAIWMLPTENVYGNWPRSGEIDIMEHVGYDVDSIFSTVHTEKYNHIEDTQVGNAIWCNTAVSDFHVYCIEWDEKQIRSYIDDTNYFTFYNDEAGEDAWPFDQQFHLLLNLAIGGNWGGREGVDDSLFPHKMEVDYVRVYQKIK